MGRATGAQALPEARTPQGGAQALEARGTGKAPPRAATLAETWEPAPPRVGRAWVIGELIVRGLEGEAVLLRMGEAVRLIAGMQLLDRCPSCTAAGILRGSSFGDQRGTELAGAKLAETTDAVGGASAAAGAAGCAETDGFAV